MTFNRTFIATMLLALGACATSPTIHYYTLSAPTPPTPIISPATPAISNYSVAVAAATVPEAVDRPQLVVRINANRVDILEDQRWADALKREIPRVVAENLAQRLAPARVAAYPQHAAESPSYTVLLDVQRFDSVPNEAATLEVIWTLRDESNATLQTRRSVLREPAEGGSYDALAAAHSRALANLSDEIAKAIQAAAAKH